MRRAQPSILLAISPVLLMLTQVFGLLWCPAAVCAQSGIVQLSYEPVAEAPKS